MRYFKLFFILATLSILGCNAPVNKETHEVQDNKNIETNKHESAKPETKTKDIREEYKDSIADLSFYGIRPGEHINKAKDIIINELDVKRQYIKSYTDKFSKQSIHCTPGIELSGKKTNYFLTVYAYQDTVFMIEADFYGEDWKSIEKMIDEKYDKKYSYKVSYYDKDYISIDEKNNEITRYEYDEVKWIFKNQEFKKQKKIAEITTLQGYYRSRCIMEHNLIYIDNYHNAKFEAHKQSILEEEERQLIIQDSINKTKDELIKNNL